MCQSYGKLKISNPVFLNLFCPTPHFDFQKNVVRPTMIGDTTGYTTYVIKRLYLNFIAHFIQLLLTSMGALPLTLAADLFDSRNQFCQLQP